MKFNRVSETELHCKISLEEIKERGFEISDLMSRGHRAWEFFESVIEEGEDATGFEKEGPMSIEGSFVGHDLELIIRSVDMDPEELKKMMEQGGAAPTLEKETLPVYVPVFSEQMTEDEAVHFKPVAVGFLSMEKLLDFARRVVTREARIALYTIYDLYVLVYDLDDCDHTEIGQFIQLANEYAARVIYGDNLIMFLYEHGKCITKDFKPF